MIPFQAILLALILTLGIFFLGVSRRRSRLTGKIILVGFVLVLSGFILFPATTTRIANLFGVGRGTDFLFYLFSLFILYIISLLYIRLRDQDRKITKLTRALAIRDAGGPSKPTPPAGAGEQTGASDHDQSLNTLALESPSDFAESLTQAGPEDENQP